MDNLINNRKVFCRYVKSADNEIANALSRIQLNRFWNLVRKNNLPVDQHPSKILPLVWPVSKIWQNI